MLPSLDAALHHHASALRELARALVGDSAADDLVQETALAALRSAQQPDAPRSWLAQVLRHLAGKHHRAAIGGSGSVRRLTWNRAPSSRFGCRRRHLPSPSVVRIADCGGVAA